jgi:hypothetical protein
MNIQHAQPRVPVNWKLTPEAGQYGFSHLPVVHFAGHFGHFVTHPPTSPMARLLAQV